MNGHGQSATSLIFFGTPDYAVTALRALHEDPSYAVKLVVTQPDRPAGRSHRLSPPPVKIASEALGLQVYQPQTLRTPDARSPLVKSGVDVFVVAAYGLIFGRRTLAIPPAGCVNVHASLLPKYRGASPVAAAILCGEQTTGVTLMLMDEGIDTGQIIDMAQIPIEDRDTTGALTGRLAELGATLLTSRLSAYVRGDLPPHPQPADGATLTRMLAKDDGRIDWSESAAVIERQVRAMWPWPRAWTAEGDRSLQIRAARVWSEPVSGIPGSVLKIGGAAVVVCGDGALALESVQPAGGKPMTGAAWLAGLKGALPVLGAGRMRFKLPPLVKALAEPATGDN